MAQDTVEGQRFHDHAGRIHQHFFRRALEKPRDGNALGVRIGKARVAGAGIRVTRVDDSARKADWRARCSRQTITVPRKSDSA
jgi:hypothetical protein